MFLNLFFLAKSVIIASFKSIKFFRSEVTLWIVFSSFNSFVPYSLSSITECHIFHNYEWFDYDSLLVIFYENYDYEGNFVNSLSKSRGFTHQSEVKYGNFYWVVLILWALLKKDSKYGRVEGSFLTIHHFTSMSISSVIYSYNYWKHHST